MTSQKSYSDSRRGKYMSLPFYGYSLRQNWPTLLLLFIAFFFSVNVPLLITLGNQRYDYGSFIEIIGTAEKYYLNLDSLISNIGFTAVIVTALLAALLAVLSFGYENKKVDAGFWHSVPLRRENLYINEVLTNLTYFFVAFASNGIISMIILASKTPLRMQDGMIYIKYLLCGLLVYFVTYFLVVLSSLICGTMAARFASALTIMFLPLGLYLSCVFAFELGSSYTNLSPTVGVIAKRICFPVRVCYMHDNLFSVGEIIAYIIVALAAFALGMLVFVKRPTESSGTPIFWKAPRSVVKYFFITVTATGLGAILYAINDSWLVFGLVSGGILAFIFMNALFNKSFKAMFKGFKWFIVFALAYALIFIGFALDPLNLDEYVPSPFVTETITVTDTYAGNSYEFADKDDIEKIRAALKETFAFDGKPISGDYAENSLKYPNYDWYDTNDGEYIKDEFGEYMDRYCRVVVYSETVWGVPCVKNIYMPRNAFAALAEVILSTDAYGENADHGMLLPEINNSEVTEISVSLWTFDCYIDGEKYSGQNENINAVLESIKGVKKPGVWYPASGKMYIHTQTYSGEDLYKMYNVLIPNDEKIINQILDILLRMYDEEITEYGETPLDTYVLSFIDHAEIKDLKTGETVKVTDTDKIKELLLSMCPTDRMNVSIFEKIYDRYVCRICTTEASVVYDMLTGFFFESGMPEFVPSLFAE